MAWPAITSGHQKTCGTMRLDYVLKYIQHSNLIVNMIRKGSALT